jgi:hypothetical protein
LNTLQIVKFIISNLIVNYNNFYETKQEHNQTITRYSTTYL